MSRVSAAAVFLIAAWFFASLPRFGSGTTTERPSFDTTFSHQADLKANVQRVLAKMQQGDGELSVAATSEDRQAKRPVVPTEQSPVRRIDLALTKSFSFFGPDASRAGWFSRAMVPGARARDVPVPPPRTKA